jgi:hypothetical protein
MTVLRREDVQSRGASWDRCPYRIASSPILTIVPLIIRRLRGPSLARVFECVTPLQSCRQLADTGAGWSAAQRKPASSRAIATATLGAGL